MTGSPPGAPTAPPTRFVAFLRAINVGGHTVKMDALRREFEHLGFTGVETLIASGNVLFTAAEAAHGEQADRQLEVRIEDHLKAVLGYAVDTFVRTPAELAQVAAHQPFDPQDRAAEGHARYVGFLHAAPAADTTARLLALRSPVDEVAVHGREVYWLCRIRSSDSALSGAVFEKTLRAPATFRNVTTVSKLAAKLAAFV